MKSQDSWWTTVLPARAANRLVGLLSQTNVTPNQVTIASALLGFAAAACFATGIYGWMSAGAVVLQISFVLDCADGQLARVKNKCSIAGGWLDIATDILKNFSFFFGLTWGSVRSGSPSKTWAWGFLAYFLSVATMFLYAIRPKQIPARVSDVKNNTTNIIIDALYHWARKHAYFLSFSVPDQLLLISICVILGVPRAAIMLMVFWGAPAMAFSLLRTWNRIRVYER